MPMPMAVERQSSVLPPAQPTYILRGHSSQIHSVKFVRNNTRLLTGDADGWVVLWKVETKRALVVWRPHDAAILGTAEWDRDKIITHGRDNHLRIWQLRAVDEPSFSKVLPAENSTTSRPKPWLLHTLPVNTLNFCSFSMCHERLQGPPPRSDPQPVVDNADASESIFIAVPARDDKKAEVYQFPEERLRFAIPRAQSTDTGMVMAIKLVHHTSSRHILLLVGYEGGLAAVFKLPHSQAISTLGVAEVIYLSQSHTQPVLSLDASPDGNTFFTSSADAIIAAHKIPEKTLETREQGESQKLAELTTIHPLEREHMLPDQAQTGNEKGLLNNVAQSGASGLSFAKQAIPNTQQSVAKSGGLSSLLSSNTSKTTADLAPPPPAPVTMQSPFKIIDTKHAGQQSLRVRSDGRIILTGGWDSRVRIYSAKTLKEIAVLKWHKDGVYATDFSTILEPGDLRDPGIRTDESGNDVVRSERGLSKLQKKREEQLQLKHWVAAGAKDAKVSLWEVF